MAKYEYADRVILEYRNFDLKTNEFLGKVRESGIVFRVWHNGYNISIRTDSGKVFVRHIDSKEVTKDNHGLTS